mmetsp:Transcript_15776/g.23224  ORF Transcript_15776/g.23224 Transcript_15776/m.23224 type:complete len:211 (-) Transcript_15776:58-690(-)|eukprot:CAMPEP_0194240362 /NCGR_PEP_ID=MMETSP0158-20130606/6558_1 /TAXON_ID=33649 /ORGANISM="Thalassionema nitzschioides, Strain L26-B" /LENGTH=210 /DNA_ID=CAMNT_0038975045 /DNA_START=121 /DNA_END=753 /DNA_ORIENTATION=-
MSEATQLQEYETQLAEIEELLQADPNDDSLLKLKNDLVELIALTKEEAAATSTGAEKFEGVDESTALNDQDLAQVPAPAASMPAPPGTDNALESNDNSKALNDDSQKKKLKKVQDFKVPTHLQVLEADTEKEANRKKRATKVLKNKHREKQREYESTKKQQSWQNFAKKGKGKRKSKSIFATQDGVKAKVGVVSGGSLTGFGERKRHKYT